MNKPTKKRQLTASEAAECAALKNIYKAKKKELGLTQDELGEKLGGINQSSVSHYLNGINALNKDVAAGFARALQVPVSDFSPRLAEEIDRLARTATQAPAIESNAEMIGMMSGWDSSTPLHDDEVAIPLYKEVEMAAGYGATEVIEVPGRLLRFAKSTLREAGVQECNAACATISGRSMERLIMDGATIGIDRGTTNIIDGEIYAFDHDGMLRVKYLYRMPGGGLRIRSENDEEYPDEIVTPDQLSHIRILGWVFWWSTIRRRNGLKLAK